MGNSESASYGTNERVVTDAKTATHRGRSTTSNRQEKLIAGSGQPFSVELIMKVSRAVCKLAVNNCTGSGFLGKYLQRDTGQYIYGFFTNNHVLNEENLAEGNTIVLSFDSFEDENVKTKTLRINIDFLFRFTCPLLDVSFVELHKEQVDSLHLMKCNFLLLSTKWVGKRGEKLIMLQYPGGSTIHFAQGSFVRRHGFDILHLVSTDYGSSGSPLVCPDGIVVGLHKRRSALESDNYNIALSAISIVHALNIHCVQGKLPASTLICNPSTLQPQYGISVIQLGLIRCPDANTFDGLVYVSPATKTATPIWFAPTSHGWYWTPTDPFNQSLETNWMSVNTVHVESGYWHNQIPVQKNIVIIEWLRNHTL